MQLPYKERCNKPFYLIRPHSCPAANPSAVDNPTTPFPVLNMIQPTSPPEIPSDVEDEVPQAGPSKRKAQPAVATVKRKSRRNSETSTAITRSPSPNGRKKLALSGDEDDFVDTPDKVKTGAGGRGGRRKATQDTEGASKDKLVIPPSITPARSASPTKQDSSDILSSAFRLGEGNPKWFKKSEIALFTDHADVITAVTWSPANHDLLASSSNDTTVRLWDFKKSSEPGSKRLELVSADGNPAVMKHVTVNKKNPVKCISWNPAGTMLVSGTMEGSTMSHSASGIRIEFTTQGTSLSINAVQFSPNGRLVTMASGTSVQIVDSSLRSKRVHKSHTGELSGC
jgi:WD40 repeat protein